MREWGWRYKNRRTIFLIHRFLGIIFSIIFIGLLVYFMIENFIALGWGIFFIGFFIFLLILDIKWDTGVLLSKRRWQYWMKTRDDANLLRKLKDPEKYRYWNRFYQRRIGIIFLFLFYILTWGIWGFLAYNQWEALLFIIIFDAIMVVVAFLAYSDILLK
jgi:hypothetical protein